MDNQSTNISGVVNGHVEDAALKAMRSQLHAYLIERRRLLVRELRYVEAMLAETGRPLSSALKDH